MTASPATLAFVGAVLARGYARLVAAHGGDPERAELVVTAKAAA